MQVRLVILLLLMLSFKTHAGLGAAFSSGQGVHDIVPYRFALAWDFGPVLTRLDTWGLHAILEGSHAIWHSPSRAYLGPDRATTLTASTLGPMVRWQRHQPTGPFKTIPYLEAGVGLSWLSDTQIQGRMLSLHFQFEDKGGVGLRFGKKAQYDLAARIYHYSNASIKRPNSGVNLMMASFGIWFD